MENWENCSNILCIRADNMGDVIMTAPAFRALRKTLKCKITLLTSKSGGLITDYIPEIDETIICDLPWVKNDSSTSVEDLYVLVEKIKKLHFDAVIIFTVYSQSALPAALFAMMAEIPKRLAYSRENPYDLLTNWVPDNEPYNHILHQIERDLNLVKHIGAAISDCNLSLKITDKSVISIKNKLTKTGIDYEKPWFVLHPGVSEEKRKYPAAYWIEIGKILSENFDIPLIITGSASETELADFIKSGIGSNAFSLAGNLEIDEFIGLISLSEAVISVNTSTIHIAAAMQTPLLVLYALSNPQHTPWQSNHLLLPFSVPKNLRSKNTIIQHVNNMLYNEEIPYPTPEKVVESFIDLLITSKSRLIRQIQKLP